MLETSIGEIQKKGYIYSSVIITVRFTHIIIIIIIIIVYYAN